MKPKIDEEAQRIVLLLKLDAKNLCERIIDRFSDYIQTFSLKRTRDHFPDIFNNRYSQLKIDDLAYCAQDTIVALDQYYTKIDDLKWYLNHTQDMPAQVEDYVLRESREIKRLYTNANLFLDAELGLIENPE